MRRFALLLTCSALFLFTFLWSSCGGGSSPSTNVASKIVISPTNSSLNEGDVRSVTAVPQDDKGATVFADLEYTSSDPTLFTVSTGGVLCGGTWSSDFVTCTPGTKVGNGTLTVKAKVTGVTATANVYVHDRIDYISITGPASCTSSADTQQLTAKAFSRNPAVCGGATSCQLPDNTVGPFGFGTIDSDIVSIDNTTTIGLATAGIPGRTFVYATSSGFASPSIIFETCPIKSVTVGIKDSTATNFAIDKSGTVSLVATAIDTKDKTLTSPPLSWISSFPFSASVSAASPATTATLTGTNPGFTFVQAACIPPACNRCSTNACTAETNPVYSTQITGKVNGTANGTVYAASSDSKSLVPIEVSSNAVGTAVALTNLPNSMAVNSTGTKMLIGSTGNPAVAVDPTSNTVTSLNVNGTVLGFNRAGDTGVLVGDSNRVLFYAVTSASVTGTYSLTPALTHIDSTINPSNILAVNGTNTFYSIIDIANTSATANSAVKDIAVLLTGQAVYLAGGASGGGISVRSTCDATEVLTEAASNPVLAESIPSGDGAVFVDDTSLIILHSVNVSSSSAGPCPPVITETRTAVALGLPAGFKANQLLVSPDSSKAIVSTDKGLVIVGLTAPFTPTKVTLGGGAVQTFSGGITADSKMLYIGADDGKVHRIDLSNNTDAQQIDPGLKTSDNSVALPQFVVVRNKS